MLYKTFDCFAVYPFPKYSKSAADNLVKSMEAPYKRKTNYSIMLKTVLPILLIMSNFYICQNGFFKVVLRKRLLIYVEKVKS